MKIKLIVLSLFIGTTFVHGQTLVKGVLKDVNNAPICFADVYFTGTIKGTTSDINGIFTLKSKKSYSKITVSFVGFEKRTIKLKKINTVGLNIILKDQSQSLDEVQIVSRPKKRVKKKKNPAYKILENIWKNKKRNGLKLAKSYEYTKYATTELGFDNMDSLFLKKVLKKDYSSLTSKMKVNYYNGKFYIPLELDEKNEKIYGNNVLNKERVDIEGQRHTGIKKLGKIFDRIAKVFQKIDVYKNNILILNKNFVSPISTEGFGTYDYVLEDSTIVENKKYYSIYFSPHRDGDFAFQGNFTVAKEHYALVNIEMKTLKKINLNFVRNIEIKKSFILKNDSTYLPTSNEYRGDFTLFSKGKKEKGVYIINKEKFSDYLLNTTRSPEFYDATTVQTHANQFEKSNEYWQEIQNKKIDNTYEIVNKIKNSKKIKSVTGKIYVLSDGYINVAKGIQMGSIWGTTAKNDIEGFRLYMGFRTFKTDNDLFRLQGYMAYGFLDKKIKYGLEGRYLLSNNPRTTISAAYLNDNEQMGLIHFNGTHLIPEADKGSKALFNRGNNFFLSRIKKSMISFDLEASKNFHISIVATQNNIKSAAPNLFSLNYLDTNTNSIKSNTTDVTTDLYFSYTPGKDISGFGVDEKGGIKMHPELLLNYRRGYKNILRGDFNYNRIQILYNYPLSLGKVGVFNTTIGAGKTFEATPLSILTAVSANQTYFLVLNTFALLDYYDFVADTYIESHIEHHFNGFLLNRIPLLKKLKIRSLLTFRGVYGSISNKSKNINRSSIIYVAPSKKPYLEYGFGFENIGIGNIRPFRLDFIWRNDFKNVNGPVNPKFGIRVGIKTIF